MPPDAEIRQRLERQLRRRVADPVWSYLVEKRYPDDVRSGAASALREMVKEVRRLEKVVRDTPRRREEVSTPRAVEVVPRLAGLEPRLEALAVLHAEYATAHDQRVSDFRLRIVSGAPLPPDKAWRLLRSPVAAHYSPVILRHFGIPIVGHDAVLTRPNSGGAAFEVTWAEGRKVLSAKVGAREASNRLPYMTDAGRPVEIDVREGSILDELRRTAQELASTYLWVAAEAARFLLEGTRPAIIAATLSVEQTFSAYPPRATVVIRSEAWIPAGVVASAYRDVQRQLLPGGSPGAGPKTGRAAAFVAEYRRSTRRFTWQSAMDAWNETQDSRATSWRDYRTFRRDCVRGERKLIFTPYRPYASPSRPTIDTVR